MDTVNPANISVSSLPDYLWQQLCHFATQYKFTPADQHWVVAYSGGKDSSVLAHLLSELKRRGLVSQVTLLHIHHGLQEQADDWQMHCEKQAEKFSLGFACQRVEVKPQSRKSLEALARTARYAALYDYCKAHRGTLLLGHHLDDVMETVLLQLKRGAGPKGLAGMAPAARKQGVVQLRPLLDVPQSLLSAYASEKLLDYIDDPSNLDQRFDRNFLRHTLTPLLTQRWPNVQQAMSRSARLCAQQDGLIQEQTTSWLAEHLTHQQSIPLLELSKQSEGWQKEIVRQWSHNITQTRPTEAQLNTFLANCAAKNDKIPTLNFAGFALRRYAEHLHIHSEVVDLATLPVELALADGQAELPHLALSVGDGEAEDSMTLATLNIRSTDVISIEKAEPDTYVEVRNAPRSLQRCFKEWQILPWFRSCSYLLLVNNQAVALLTYRRCVVFGGDEAASHSRQGMEGQFLYIGVTD